eukprot:gene32323-39092_t
MSADSATLKEAVLDILLVANTGLSCKDILRRLRAKDNELFGTLTKKDLKATLQRNHTNILEKTGLYQHRSKVPAKKNATKSVRPSAMLPPARPAELLTERKLVIPLSDGNVCNSEYLVPANSATIHTLTSHADEIYAEEKLTDMSTTESDDEIGKLSSEFDAFLLSRKADSEEDSLTLLKKQGTTLFSEQVAANWPDCALLGSDAQNQKVYLNTHEPFCLVAVGLQGSGKSHSVSCVLENCLLPVPGYVTLAKPMNALVLHYDTSDKSICETIGLGLPNKRLEKFAQEAQAPWKPINLPNDKITIFVSPSYFLQRKGFYQGFDVRPLLFSWQELTADHIKRLMAIQDKDSQLYMAVLLDMLRQYQSSQRLPTFDTFLKNIKDNKDLSGQQQGPLQQRLSLLESFVFDSQRTREQVWYSSIAEKSCSVLKACESGRLVIVDLTDPLLSHSEANTIFQVVVEQYRANPDNSYSKLLVVDEAHKFMNGKSSSDGLSAAIVNIARLMRHDGIRLAVSTQDPQALAPELLELTSVALMHHFRSKEWFNYLAGKLSLGPGAFSSILDMEEAGSALVAVAKHALDLDDQDNDKLGHNVFSVKIRQRFTSDYGVTRTNL